MSDSKQDLILQGLNDAQLEAVTTTEGPLLILAGAGSGKTRVLAHRIAYLIRSYGVNPASILAVTFTNKAAGEMKERILGLLAGASDQEGEEAQLHVMPGKAPKGQVPAMGTFHSICAQILRREIQHLNRANNFVIFDTLDQVSVIRDLIKELSPHSSFAPRAVLSAISRAKSDMQDASEYARQVDPNYFTDLVAQIFPRYEQALKANEALDFDDLLVLTVELFENNPVVLAKYHGKWQYILIDEYQDTNQVQYRLAKALAREGHNICVVGDENQSIYGFRGADIGNILAFTKDYPESKIIKLEQNYRSTEPILQAANAIIQHNASRSNKELWSARKSGDKPLIYEALDETQEAKYVIDQIKNMHNSEKIPYEQMAVLYRTNAQSRAFEEACISHNIPYRLVGGVKFYERKEIKDLLAFLRYIQNPEEKVSFKRIVNVPPRGIGTTSLREMLDWAAQVGGLKQAFGLLRDSQSLDDIPINSRGKNALQDFAQMLASWEEIYRTCNILELFDAILDSVNYLSYINDGTDQAQDRFENIQELRKVISSYTEYGPVHGLTIFLEESALLTSVDEADFHQDAITLITMHAVKGLEFEVVFLAGLDEGLFPHSRCLDSEKELEEERRLCYVGITRAKTWLYLLHTQMRTTWGETSPSVTSRFLTEIPEELVEYDSFDEDIAPARSAYGIALPPKQPLTSGQKDLQASKQTSKFKEGQKVRHKSFGLGRIVQIKGEELSVVFEKAGLKKLLESLAPLEKVDSSQ